VTPDQIRSTAMSAVACLDDPSRREDYFDLLYEADVVLHGYSPEPPEDPREVWLTEVQRNTSPVRCSAAAWISRARIGCPASSRTRVTVSVAFRCVAIARRAPQSECQALGPRLRHPERLHVLKGRPPVDVRLRVAGGHEGVVDRSGGPRRPGRVDVREESSIAVPLVLRRIGDQAHPSPDRKKALGSPRSCWAEALDEPAGAARLRRIDPDESYRRLEPARFDLDRVAVHDVGHRATEHDGRWVIAPPGGARRACRAGRPRRRARVRRRRIGCCAGFRGLVARGAARQQGGGSDGHGDREDRCAAQSSVLRVVTRWPDHITVPPERPPRPARASESFGTRPRSPRHGDVHVAGSWVRSNASCGPTSTGPRRRSRRARPPSS
jgi:hypothetical protein